MATEREVKLGAWAGFELPDLQDIADGVTAVAKAPRTLVAVYYDTADLRLARWGVTVRHRSGDASSWTVKLPDGDDGPALVRRELSFDGPPTRMPDAAASLLRAYVRGGALAPVAKLRTIRAAVDLLDGEGATVAEVVDDEVSVLHGGRVAARFREVEVEVGERVPDGLLETVVERLRRAGAGSPEKTPKVIRALGARALEPPEVVVTKLGKHPSAGDVARQAVALSVTRLLQHDPGVRVGDDPEDVHQARVATRRLRSDLRTFDSVFDPDWVASLRSELGWLAAALGAVRDGDVLIARFRIQAAGLPEPDTGGLAPVFRRLATEREAARAGLLVVLDSSRYIALLDRLVAGAQDPPMGGEAGAPASALVIGLVSKPWRRLERAVRSLPARPSDDELHRVRILSKRARYAVEAAAPIAGKRAAAFATALAGVQTVLGDHHDAVVAEAWLRQAADVADPAVSLAVGELIAVQRATAASCRKAWPKAWAKASDRKLRSWL